jgi:hypothetical protein
LGIQEEKDGEKEEGDEDTILKKQDSWTTCSKDPRMNKTMGKRQKKPHIQCWGCGGDHMYKDFPHIGENVRFIRNVQKVDTIEDMGRNVSRIYASLDNKQDEFQSHMIEVGGNINNNSLPF